MAMTNKVLLCVVSGVVVLGVVGWAVGSQVQSPADAAAAHRPPAASLITAGVEKRVLTSTVVTQGTVGYSAAHPLNFAGTVAPSQGAGSQPLVTKAAHTGRINEGSVLLEVSGRPVLVLKGRVPMYRTLARGSTGDDVRQLQQGLTNIGFPTPVTGTYGTATERAVSQWYARHNYTPASGSEQPSSADGGQPPSSATAGATASPAATASAATTAVTVPSGELIFLPDLPARLTDVSASVGAPATGRIGSVSSSVLQVQAQVPTSDAQLVKVGAKATMQTSDGKQFSATVTTLGSAAASKRPASGTGSGGTSSTPASGDTGGDTSGGGAQATTSILVVPQHPNSLASYTGQAVKITIKVGSTGGQVLVVPASALSTKADGKAWVRVAHGNGRTTDVAVTPGLTVSGDVQVTPTRGGALNSGDQVVIGTSQESRS